MTFMEFYDSYSRSILFQIVVLGAAVTDVTPSLASSEHEIRPAADAIVAIDGELVRGVWECSS
jgi:chemotaxis signal transduction protein